MQLGNEIEICGCEDNSMYTLYVHKSMCVIKMAACCIHAKHTWCNNLIKK